MELQILVSKKGTKVVTASNLHMVLQLPKHQYIKNVQKWLKEVYGFRDSIRRPEELRDFARRPVQGEALMEDYFLSIELAKLITLHSQSKVKQKFARWLLSLEEQVQHAELLNQEQILTVVELAKVMGLLSCQQATEQHHRKQYEAATGSDVNWWNYRSGILGYSIDDLRKKCVDAGKAFKGKTQKQMLLQIDRFETVRTAVIDLFIGLGKSERFARNMGDLAKAFAKELDVNVTDDQDQDALFSFSVNNELANEIKTGQPGAMLRVF